MIKSLSSLVVGGGRFVKHTHTTAPSKKNFSFAAFCLLRGREGLPEPISGLPTSDSSKRHIISQTNTRYCHCQIYKLIPALQETIKKFLLTLPDRRHFPEYLIRSSGSPRYFLETTIELSGTSKKLSTSSVFVCRRSIARLLTRINEEVEPRFGGFELSTDHLPLSILFLYTGTEC